MIFVKRRWGRRDFQNLNDERKKEMGRKKALSLLLAAAMVFSSNTISFAEETADEGVIEITAEEDAETESKVSGDSVASDSRSVNDRISVSGGFNGKADMSVTYHAASYYTGKNIKASDLEITVSVDGYIVDAKGLKIMGSKKAPAKGNTFKIKSIDTNYKNIRYAHDTKIGSTSVSADDHVYDSRSGEEAGERAAKAALKAVKKDFNRYLKKSENNSFSFDIAAVYIDRCVTYKELKSLKVSGNSYAFDTYDESMANTAVVKISNSGKVSGVYILARGKKRTNGTYSVRKVKLKKNSDYRITNSVLTFEGSNINYSEGFDLTKIGASAGQNS